LAGSVVRCEQQDHGDDVDRRAGPAGPLDGRAGVGAVAGEPALPGRRAVAGPAPAPGRPGGIALSLTSTAATAQYFIYGLLVRPGALPAARYAVLYQPATTFTALTLIGFVLLLTPTGSLPSPRWRWPARVMAVTPVALVLVVTLAGGPVNPRHQALGGPFSLSCRYRVARSLGLVSLAGQRYSVRRRQVAFSATLKDHP
jgi:hypothetical protein